MQHITRVSNLYHKARKRIKGLQIEKKEVKLFFILWDMIIFGENPVEATKMLLQ